MILTDEQLEHIANYIAGWTYERLISTTTISRTQAQKTAINAARKAAQAIALSLSEDGGKA